MSWAVAVLGWAGLAVGCRDARRGTEAISREDPPPLSLAAEGAGAGQDGRAKAPPDAAHAPEPASAQAVAQAVEAAEDQAGDKAEDRAADEKGGRTPASARGRRRRPVPAPGEPGAAARAPAEGAAPAPAGEEAQPELKVTRLVLAKGISGREPVGVGTSFKAGELEKLYAFVTLTNEARAATGIVVAFAPPGGGAPVRIKLDVGTERRWRTWATTRKARAPGAWSVSVSDASGAVLARSSFTITE
ncbi:MAG: DUF2914 domain-containing protein [Polyangiaceae bacterium]|nr:DUF2914 domain-containing protein [Polyangiaceae bacterium]